MSVFPFYKHLRNTSLTTATHTYCTTTLHLHQLLPNDTKKGCVIVHNSIYHKNEYEYGQDHLLTDTTFSIDNTGFWPLNMKLPCQGDTLNSAPQLTPVSFGRDLPQPHSLAVLLWGHFLSPLCTLFIPNCLSCFSKVESGKTNSGLTYIHPTCSSQEKFTETRDYYSRARQHRLRHSLPWPLLMP